jgi:hypothetical protein
MAKRDDAEDRAGKAATATAAHACVRSTDDGHDLRYFAHISDGGVVVYEVTARLP